MTQQFAPELGVIAAVLDPVLVPLGFAAAQIGVGEASGQAIFCRGMVEGIDDGCVDLVLDLAVDPNWRIVDVRYDGFASEHGNHLAFDENADLPDQLAGLAASLPMQLPA